MTRMADARPTLSRRGLMQVAGGAVAAAGMIGMGAGAGIASAAQKRIPFVFRKQETSYSCSAASSRMVLSGHGIHVAESDVRAALKVSPQGGLLNINYVAEGLNSFTGTTFHRVRQWKDKATYAAKLDADVRHNVDHGYGVILNVWYVNRGHNNSFYTKYGHYLAIMGYNETHYFIGDSANALNTPGFWAPKANVVGWNKDLRYVAGVNITRRASVYTSTTLPTLEEKAVGHQVQVLQHLLVHHKSASIKADGVFGAATAAGVKTFQSSKKLVADAIVGAKTWDGLLVRVAKDVPGTTAAADAVRAVQVSLNIHGASLAVDGVLGARTTAAVKAFQTRHKLASDGIVGPKTWAALV